jgi:hypothetical protein
MRSATDDIGSGIMEMWAAAYITGGEHNDQLPRYIRHDQ